MPSPLQSDRRLAQLGGRQDRLFDTGGGECFTVDKSAIPQGSNQSRLRRSNGLLKRNADKPLIGHANLRRVLAHGYE